jgi:hypothetical protein
MSAAKKKNDQMDASKIADCLRCDFLPESHRMPREIRDRRRTLRYRHLLVRQMVQMKNRVSGLLMETGVEYNKQRLHKVSYFRELLSSNSVTLTAGPRSPKAETSTTSIGRVRGSVSQGLLFPPGIRYFYLDSWSENSCEPRDYQSAEWWISVVRYGARASYHRRTGSLGFRKQWF